MDKQIHNRDSYARTQEEVIVFPPFVTCRLCVNQLSDWCMEDCAPARDYRHFEMRKDVDLLAMPRFPLHEFLEDMAPKVRQIVVAIYIAKISDYLQGVSYGGDNSYRPSGRW